MNWIKKQVKRIGVARLILVTLATLLVATPVVAQAASGDGSTVDFVPYLLTLALAAIVEGCAEYYFSPWVAVLTNWIKKKIPSLADQDLNLMRYAALAVAMPLSFAYECDLIAAFLGRVPNPPWLGVFLTGTLIARGANVVHDFVMKFLARQRE